MSFNFANLVELYGIDTIFKDIKIPENIDKEIMINSILDECAEYEPWVYDMPLLNWKVKNFFLKNYEVFNRLNVAFNENYNALENYDKKMESTTDLDSKGSNNKKSKDLTTVSAYDSTSFENDNQLDSTSQIDDKRLENTKYIEHTHGNIGVTTSQQMLESELNVRPKLNIYKYIANSFYDEFMLKLA